MAVSVLLTFISYYFYIVSKAKEAASEAINKAEDADKSGTEKLNLAVKQVYELIPITARMFIPKSVIKTLVQAAFDNIEEYAKKQIAKKSK